MNRKIKTFLIVITIPILLFCFFNFPAYYASRHTPPGFTFTGLAPFFDPWDTNVYLSTIRWGQKFGLYTQNTFTTDPSTSFVVYPLYTISGLLFPKVNALSIYYLLLGVTALAFSFTIYKVSLLFGLKRYRYALLFFVPFGSGLGGLISGNLQTPDRYISSFTFASGYSKPHELFALTFYILSLGFFYKAIRHKNLRLSIISSILFVLTLFFYPYLAATYFVITVLAIPLASDTTAKTFIKKVIFSYRENSKLLIPLLSFALPTSIFYSLKFLSLKGYGGLTSQNLGSIPFITVLLGFGIFLPFAIMSAIRSITSPTVRFLTLWFLIHLAFASSNLSFARLYFRSIFLPLTFLAFSFLSNLPKNSYLRGALFQVFIFLSPLSNMILLIHTMYFVLIGSPWFYLKNTSLQVISYLNSTSDTASGTIANEPLSTQIPAYTYNKVYAAHPLQTPDYEEKIALQDKFYTGKLNTNESVNIMRNNNVSFIVWEKNQFELPESYLEKFDQVFENDDYIILKVNN